MVQNKNHWYDGWFYDSIIAPNQDKLFSQIKNLIEDQKTIIDVGCGTGRLAFTLADQCKSVLGIDLSKRNIDRAHQALFRQPNDQISFQHCSLTEILNERESHFDYAVLTYVIHEVNEEERINLLNEIAQVADMIIIGDYLVPRPSGFNGYLSKIIEFIAGKEHYRNYKRYMANGGIHYLAKEAGLNIVQELSNQSSTNHIVILEGGNKKW